MKAHIHFILIDTAVPGNIGASARAIKTMGFQSLYLVNPHEHLCDEARWMAHASNDILEKAEVFDSFDEAVAGLDFVIGTTAKRRSVKYNYYVPEQLPQLVENKGDLIRNVGIVFGKEESGLSNEMLDKCDILTTIPMAEKYPSLNLSQAVMVYAYALSRKPNSQCKTESVKQAEFEVLKHKIETLLPGLNIKKGTNLYNRIRERLMTVSEEDVHLLLSFSDRIEKEKFRKT